MGKLYLYNTLSRKKEEFKPINDGKVGLYTCGPTVYNYAHIGNLRAYVFDDILARVLKYGYGREKVKWVMNITDVDDKTIRDSKAKYPDKDPKDALRELTCGFESLFWNDLEKLNIQSPDIIPHAADERYVEKMKDLVKKISEGGYAYVKDGSVYFNIEKYREKFKYGQLVNLDMSSLKAGTRIDSDEYEKNNVQDFVLWKGRKDGEPFWDFELQGEKLPGRPGWHIECSAMGEAELGLPFDIHAGGEDLKFPHHEDEIAQSAAGFDLDRPVNYWLHSGMLLVDGQKMSKSLDNFYRLADLAERGKNPLAFRYLCLMTHYRKPMDFSWQSLDAAENGLMHLHNQVRELLRIGGTAVLGQIDQKSKDKFLDAINDDLNMPQTLAVVQELLKSDLSREIKLNTILDFDEVLGLGLNKIYSVEEILPNEIQSLKNLRQIAKSEKDWLEADRLRTEIENNGFIVEDTKDGMKIRKK